MALDPEDKNEIQLIVLNFLKDGCEYGRNLYTGYQGIGKSLARTNELVDVMRDKTFPRLFNKVERIESSVEKAQEASERAATALENNQKLIMGAWWRRIAENTGTVIATMAGLLAILKALGKI